MLTFGYNRGLPATATTAWGCRAIIERSHGHSHGHGHGGHVDVPPDRQSATGPRIDVLLEHLNVHVRGAWRDRAHELLTSGAMHPGRHGEFVLYRDDTVVIKANPQGSGGYLYVCAYLRDEEDR